MLTESEVEEDLFAAVRAGATGYLLKEVAIEELAEAVRAVARGQASSRPSMTTQPAVRVQRAVAPARGATRQRPRLTDRELEVLRLDRAGACRTRTSATELVIAENTVRNHVRNILEKLQLREPHGSGDVRSAREARRRNLIRDRHR